jgi:hypothetical protein
MSEGEDTAIFYIDRCLGNKIIVEALLAAGLKVFIKLSKSRS